MRSGALWTFFLSRMKLTSLFFSSGASARIKTSKPTAAGRTIFVQRTSRSCALPGSAQRCLTAASRALASAIVRENVLFGPAGEVEQSAGRKEIETILRECDAVLSLHALVEPLLELVKVAHVARGIIELGVDQTLGPPVTA